MGKLAGIRVIDMSRVLAGPLVGQMLADLGADVIKIERPQSGDEARQYGPPFWGDEAHGATSFFLAANRNKRSVAIDFSQPEGARILEALIAEADVVIENFRVGTLQRYGLDYETLSARCPALVYCSLTGFGQTGPYAERPGYDAIFQAMGGLMSTIGYPDDHPAAGPLRSGLSITDVITSLYASLGVIAALHARQHNGGRGDHVDVALMDCTVATLSHYAMHYLISGQMIPRRGNSGNGGTPSQVFHCRDGAIMLTVGNDAQFQRFCRALGHPEWAEDKRFATGVSRIRHRDVLVPMLEAHFATLDAAPCLQCLIDAEIPAGAINDVAQLFQDPQVQARGLKRSIPDAQWGDTPTLSNPILFRQEPVSDYRRPPHVGEHTQQILSQWLGMDEAQLASLTEQNIVGHPPQI